MTLLIPTSRKLRLLALSALAGVLAGLSSALFLFLLDFATHVRKHDHFWVWLLPVAGLLIALVYHHFGAGASRGHDLVLDEIHDPRKVLPARMAPLVLASTVLTHLCGGSAGREGTAVQVAASLSDQLSRWGDISPDERRSLLMAGAGAGFGAAIGAPLAGIIFGMEVIQIGRLRFFALAECAVASLVAALVAFVVHAPHTLYPAVEVPSFEWHLPILAVFFGAFFGLVARSFVIVEHGVSIGLGKLFRYPPLRALAGGTILSALFFWEGTYRYCGLGIETIQAALTLPSQWPDPFLKLGFTALTLGAGFKGGEFIPLVFIGSTLGSVLAGFLGLPVPLFAALGFAAVFGAAANAPLACAVMAAELFGWKILPYAWLACTCGYLSSGHPGIYRRQPLKGGKGAGLLAAFSDIGRRFHRN